VPRRRTWTTLNIEVDFLRQLAQITSLNDLYIRCALEESWENRAQATKRAMHANRRLNPDSTDNLHHDPPIKANGSRIYWMNRVWTAIPESLQHIPTWDDTHYYEIRLSTIGLAEIPVVKSPCRISWQLDRII
jgi:hypothetical protein